MVSNRFNQGAGHQNGNDYIREFNEFYFLVVPELLIKSHYPSDEKWQLTKKIYTLKEFEKQTDIHSTFYQCGFITFSPYEGYLELKIKIHKYLLFMVKI